jgi:hypothetical protein
LVQKVVYVSMYEKYVVGQKDFFLFNPIDREDILRWLVCEEKVGKIK